MRSPVTARSTAPLGLGEARALLQRRLPQAEILLHELWDLTGGDGAMLRRLLTALAPLLPRADDAVLLAGRVALLPQVQACARAELDRLPAESLSAAATAALLGTGFPRPAPNTGSGPGCAAPPLLHEALIGTLSEPQRDAIHRRAAREAMEHREVLLALTHALAAGDLVFAEAVAQQAWIVLRRHHAAAVAREIAAVPAERLRDLPYLLLLGTLSAVAAGAETTLVRALLGLIGQRAERFSESRDAVMPTECRILHLAVAAAASRTGGDPAMAAGFAATALRLLEELGPEQHAVLSPVLPPFAVQLGLSLYVGGELSAARTCFAMAQGGGARAEAGRGHDTADESAATDTGRALLGLMLAEGGDIRRAKQLLQQVRASPDDSNPWAGHPASALAAARAWIALERQDLAAAHHELDSVGANLASIEQWGPLVRARTMTMLAGGDLPAALALLRSSQRSAQTFGGVPRLEFDLTRAFVELAAGELEVAESLLVAVGGPVAAVIGALASLLRGDPAHALARLDEADAAQPELSPRIRCHALLLRAIARERLGDSQAATRDATAACLRMDELGLSSPLWLLAVEDRATLRGLLHEPRAAGWFQRSRGFEGYFRAIPLPPLLSERELVVLGQLQRGGSAQAIAERLHVSLNTVKSQLRSIYRKLAVTSREDALDRAAELGLLQAGGTPRYGDRSSETTKPPPGRGLLIRADCGI